MGRPGNGEQLPACREIVTLARGDGVGVEAWDDRRDT
jgi:hypothetical protein